MGGLRKNPFHGGGMDIFWNHTLEISKTGVFNKNLLYLFPAISTSSTVLMSPGSNLTAVPAAIFCQQNE